MLVLYILVSWLLKISSILFNSIVVVIVVWWHLRRPGRQANIDASFFYTVLLLFCYTILYYFTVLAIILYCINYVVNIVLVVVWWQLKQSGQLVTGIIVNIYLIVVVIYVVMYFHITYFWESDNNNNNDNDNDNNKSNILHCCICTSIEIIFYLRW